MNGLSIVLNGESYELPKRVSVLELFELLDLSTKFMAVEINDEIILPTGSATDSDFINYEDLNESIVLSWVTGSLDVDSLKAINSSSINIHILNESNIKAQGLPW